MENLCADHCREHALSDTQCVEFTSPCTHAHAERCENCDLLRNTMSSILSEVRESQDVQFYSTNQQEGPRVRCCTSTKQHFQWKAHILRAANLDRAKTDAVKSVQCDTILVMMDWAMKFTQMKYREKQSEWFGQRGMNWQISCVLSKREDEEQLDVTSYVHLFDSYAKDSYTVFAILIHLLKTVKIANPHISKALLRSDGDDDDDRNIVVIVIAQYTIYNIQYKIYNIHIYQM